MSDFTVITQARMKSTRLPDKVMMKVKGKPLLYYHLERVKLARNVTDIIVATSRNDADDEIYDFCEKYGVTCFRGSEDDVLDRFYQTAKEYKLENIIRLTADCPLIDYRIIDDMITEFCSKNIDYLSNTLKPTFPDGMDVCIFTYRVLETAWQQAELPSEREHVIPYIAKNSTYNGKSLFSSDNFEFKIDFSHVRLTVDEKEDFDLIKFLIEHSSIESSWLEYVSILLKYPQLLIGTMNYERNEGFRKSLEEDEVFVRSKEVKDYENTKRDTTME